ncbi:MAG: DedA family protein [Acidobacteriota bacterium]|jgi:membrane protein DedA with SNARE-associated domain
MIDSITHYLVGLNPLWLYVALFLCAYIENIVPPIPGDTVTVFAGYLLGRTDRSAAGILISTTLGSTAGFMTYYTVGRLIHPEYFARKNFRFFPASQIELAKKWFLRYGSWVILLNRFFSGIRSVISIVTGLCRLPWLRVLLLSGMGCVVWNALLIWAGYQLGENWTSVSGFLATYNRVLAILAIVLAGVWLLRRQVSRARTR